MEVVFLKLLNMSITASWLVLAVMAVRLVFRRTPKWILCLLWGLVAFRLICPVSIESPLSLVPRAEPLPQNVIYTAEPERKAGGEILDSGGNVVKTQLPPASQGKSSEPDVTGNNPGAAPVSHAGHMHTRIFFFSRIWLAGVFAMLIYTLISYCLLKHKVATAIPLRKGVKQSEFVDTPFVLGLIRPVIYLPFGIASPDMAYVIAHEMAHIRRKDHWWKPIGFLLLSIYWYNPLLWVAYILLCRDIEAACDEKVIKDMEKDERRAYSTALLNCSVHRRRIAACPLAFGEIGVKARVRGVMNYKKPTFWIIVVCLLLILLISVCFLTSPEREDAVLPISMRIDYVDRKGATLRFLYDAPSAEDYQISEIYSLETFHDGSWRELPNLTEEQTAYKIIEAAPPSGEFDAWSILDWEKAYGCLPDGSYRIKKEIISKNDSEICPVYAEFVIGGSAEAFITYRLENITPVGAKLYEQEHVEDPLQLVYGGEGFWLETLQEGRWTYLEPTDGNHSSKKRYIHELIYPGSHTELDWSSLYGELPAGIYRICREITNTSEADLRVCTVYAEFSIDQVTTWFDRGSDHAAERMPKSTHIALPGADEMSISYDSFKNEISLITSGGTTPVISYDHSIRNVFLSDLNGDEVSEICTTGDQNTGTQVQVYDAVNNAHYALPVAQDYYHVLTKKADRLCVLQHTEPLNAECAGKLGILHGELKILEPDDTLLPFTKEITGVDIWNRKQVSVSSGEELDNVLELLHDLKDRVVPAAEKELEAAKADSFYHCSVVVNYALGRKMLNFSRDFQYVWESGSSDGFRLLEPQPLLHFTEAVSNGVQGKKTFGKPFATVDAPWDWCSGIHADAIESAHAHVCVFTHSEGSTSTSSSSMGAISYNTLNSLISILDKIPKAAFTPEKTITRNTFHSLHYRQTVQNSSIALVDGVNQLAVVINYCDGALTMLLTDEMDKVKDIDMEYLEPTQLWSVQDENLSAFMLSVMEDPPVITYFVGSEYEWQEPIQFTAYDFSITLRLIQGWNAEYITESGHSGIRCRPDGEEEGWIYFSYWPQEYIPEKTDQYIAPGSHYDWNTYTSYPLDSNNPNAFSSRDMIWSYQRFDLTSGDYVVINDGADSWFLEYKDQIEDMITLSEIAAE